MATTSTTTTTTTTTTTSDTSLDFDPYGKSSSAQVLGTAAADKLFGGAGADIIDGRAGSDDIKAGSGNDVMLYTLTDNLGGAKDIYTGGSGLDTIRIQLSQEQWADTAIRAELERYVNFLTTVKKNTLGEVSNGIASDFMFDFGGGTTLTVQMTEKLVVAVWDGTGYADSRLGSLITGTSTGGVIEAGGVANATEGVTTTSGTLHSDDLDGPDTFEAPTATSLTGTYGTFTFNSTSGEWTYALDNTLAATQALTAGETKHDKLTVTSYDGTDSQEIDVTVTGANDNASISGTATDSVTEAGGASNTGGDASASGILSVSDVDAGQAVFQAVAAASLAGTYGSFTFNASTGAWTYELDNTRAATQALTAGETKHDKLTVTSSDGTASQQIDVTITGANDNASISGTATDSVTEAGGVANGTSGDASASGTLSVSDVDAGQAVFQAVAAASLAGTYGSFTFNSTTGEWTYELDNTRAATQALTDGQVKQDKLTVTSSDGTASQEIVVTITGANDNASISGTATDSVTEAGGVANGTSGDASASGTLSVSDVDAGQSVFQAVAAASLAGTYGSFTFNSTTGAWSYTLNNDSAATQALTAGETKHDKLTVTSSDGTASREIDVTVTGANDNASISGSATDSVTEAGGVANGTSGDASASGSLSVSDVDAGQAVFQAVAAASLAGTYGSFTFNASTGAWTYALDNDSAATQALTAGETKHDKLTVTSSDGTASREIDVTVTGANDNASISGTATDSVTEAGGASNTGGDASASGILSVSDVDAGQAVFQAVAAASLTGTYGSFTFDASTGAWTYALDNDSAATQALTAGETKHDKLTVTSSDGTATREIDVTVTGANDNASISGSATDSVTEAGGVANGTSGDASASGTLSVSDVDAGQAVFQAVAAASLAGTYGSFTFNASTGAWTYELDNARAATQALTAGETKHDKLTVTSSDGTASQEIDVTITGANDNALIAGTTSGSVTEDSPTTTATGTLTATDVDNTNNLFQAVAAGSATANGYGTFGMTSAGVWTYTLNNSNATVNALNTGGTLNDSFSVLSADGTSQLVNVTINGNTDVTNSAPTNITILALEPGANIPGAGTIATLSTTDADVGDSHTYSVTTLSGASIFSAVGSNLVISSALGQGNLYTIQIQTTDSASNSYSETFNIITGGPSSDTSLGGTGGSTYEDLLYGFNAEDIIFGGSGDDTLFGQKGNDQLYGGEGSDTLNGGEGSDRFVFNTATGSSNVDTIVDFISGTDKIVLEDAIFTALSGSLSASAFDIVGDATAASAATRIIYDQASGALSYDVDGTGATAAVQIAIIGTTTHPTLTAADFTVI